MIIKTNREHFELFKKEVAKWVDFFGISEWDINYSHIKLANNKAEISMNLCGRCATISLSTHYGNSNIEYDMEEDIKLSAFHEVIELILGPLGAMVRQRFGISQEDVDEEIHRVVRRFEFSVFKKMERADGVKN